MAESRVEGPDLKKMVRLARKRPVSFGFNPAQSDADTYLAMHKKLAAPRLGKETKKEGETAKVAFGTASVDGKCLNLTCERTLPAMAKRMKRYLKYNKVTLNVQVMDAQGNVLESDIEEDLADDPSLYDDDDVAGETEAPPSDISRPIWTPKRLRRNWGPTASG